MRRHVLRNDRQIGDNMQSDLIALCAIDSVNKKITIINIPRDIITDVKVYSPSGGYVEMKKLPIAEAFAYGDGKKGSCFNSAEAVSKLFYNLPIRTFFALNLDGIAELTDSVGGVDVVSPETIGEFEKGESYHLEGKKATNFVRRRATDRADANLLRNDRQKEYLKSIINKFFKATRSNISVPVNVFNAVQSYSSTNLNPEWKSIPAGRLQKQRIQELFRIRYVHYFITRSDSQPSRTGKKTASQKEYTARIVSIP